MTSMVKVYKFFGFGDRIQKWLKSIGTGRRACIITSPGEVSKTFELDKGHAQGDSPSPLLYNFAAQILLFKIASGSTACFNVLKAEGEKHGLTIATFNLLSCFNSSEDLAGIMSSTGLPICREDVEVHLTAAAYNDIAAVLSIQAENNDKKPVTGQVRRRLASVIPSATAATPWSESQPGSAES